MKNMNVVIIFIFIINIYAGNDKKIYNKNNYGFIKRNSDIFKRNLKSSVKELFLDDKYRNKELSYVLDNSSNKFFRPVFDQEDQSCSQASAVSYIFTYEINRIKNLSSDIIENQYPSHFTFNFLNEGDGNNGDALNSGVYFCKMKVNNKYL